MIKVLLGSFPVIWGVSLHFYVLPFNIVSRSTEDLEIGLSYLEGIDRLICGLWGLGLHA